MSFYKKQRGKKYHKRTIDVSISDYDGDRFVIEGCLTDQRYQQSHIMVEDIESFNERIARGLQRDKRANQNQTSSLGIGGLLKAMGGAMRSPGILHQIIIHLLINKVSMEIEDVHVEMPSAPREECRETVDSLSGVKGLSISRGFMSKIKGMAGDGKGCRHMVELLIAMAPAIIQGAISHRISQPSSKLSPSVLNRYIDTCRVWRADSPLVSLLKEQIQKQK